MAREFIAREIQREGCLQPRRRAKFRADFTRVLCDGCHSVCGRLQRMTTQLIKSRVLSAGCSIAPQSSSGMKQQASSSAHVALRFAASIMAGFKFHKIL